MTDKIVNIPRGDNRLSDLHDDIYEAICEYGHGIPYPSILGVLEIVKDTIKEKQNEDME